MLESYAADIKPTLYSEEFLGLEKVQHLSYFVSNLFTFKTFENMDKSLLNLADICLEFWYLPNPYGEMASKMCEILENESYFPIITKLKRLIEDFPKIIEFERKGENKSLAHYQNVLVYETKFSSRGSGDEFQRYGNKETVNLIKYLKSCHTQELFAKDLNQYRYTFIYKLLKHNKKQKSMANFMTFLKTLPSNYVWELFMEVLDIITNVEEYEQEGNISASIAAQLEKLAEQSMQNMVVQSTDISRNVTNYKYPQFKINFANDFVTVSSNGSYSFNQDVNYQDRDFETSTMKR